MRKQWNGHVCLQVGVQGPSVPVGTDLLGVSTHKAGLEGTL